MIKLGTLKTEIKMVIDKEFEKLRLEYDSSNSILITIAVLMLSSIISLYSIGKGNIYLFLITIVITILFFFSVIKRDKCYNRLHNYLTKK